jgi:hypothetical protein
VPRNPTARRTETNELLSRCAHNSIFVKVPVAARCIVVQGTVQFKKVQRPESVMLIEDDAVDYAAEKVLALRTRQLFTYGTEIDYRA